MQRRGTFEGRRPLRAPAGGRVLAASMAAALTALIAAGGGCRQGDARRAPEGGEAPRSLLVLTFDTTRADHLSVYGGKAQTPALERMAREGVRFDLAIAPTPITLPSHVSLFTGLYPIAHGVRNNGTFRLGDEARTLAEILREAGFRTAAVIGSQILDSRYGLDQGFEVYDDDLPPEEKVKTFFVERPAAAVADRALAWLRGRGEERWFLWVHFFDPHYEYQPPEPHRSRHPDSPYDGEIAYADEQAGRLVAALEESGRLDRTLVVMAADHGESLGEHGETTHGIFIYDSTTRVPLLMRHPGRLGRGARVPEQVRLVDVMPTVLELLEIPAAGRPVFHGESLLPLVGGGAGGAGGAGRAAPPRAAWIESWLPRFNYAWSELSGVREAGWKYIRAPIPELYDLAADAGESRNLAARELARAEEYAAQVARTEASLRPAAGRDLARTQEVDAETRESLAALGYITLAGPGDAAAGAPLPDPKEKIGEYEEMARALALMRRGREAEAIPILERALKANPRSAYLTRSLGSAYRHAGRQREGIEMMLRSLEIEPASFGTLTDLGAAYFEIGEIDRAEEIFQQVLKINPHVAVALSNLGLIEQKRGRRDAAMRLYERALVEDPSLLRALVNLALLYEEAKRPAEAVPLYLRAVDLDPENEKLFYSAGYLLFQAGRYDEAMAVLQRAQSAHPRSPRPALYRAQILQKRGELDAAEREVRAALALDPASAEARRQLASIEARRRKGGS